jgi:outer membrane protein insertion porin family
MAWLLVAGTAVAQPASAGMDGRSIEGIEIHGNHRIEFDAIRLQVGSKVGQPLDVAQLRADERAIWKLGVFGDLRVMTEVTPTGGVRLAFEVEELPAIRKVLVAGHHELGLDKINDVLELRRDAIASLAAIRKDRDRIAALYLEHGYSLSTVDLQLVPAGSGEVDVVFTVDEHGKIRVRDVAFTGNHAISDDELRATLTTRPAGALSVLDGSGTYRLAALERDLAILTARYLDGGFATVKIGTPSLRLSRDKTFMHVTIPIDEGPRFEFGTIDVTGDLLGSPASHLARIASRTGATFSRSEVERGRKALETYYQDQGFASVNVVPRMHLDLANRRVPLTFEIVRGKRTYVERIHIRGNSKTRDKVIRRELRIAEGELFNGSRIEASRRHILALGYFENVVVSTTRGSSDEFLEINVEVHERRTGTFQIGAGYSSAQGPIVQGQVSYDNFLGRGESVALQAQLSGLRRMFTFRFVEPYFLDTRWTFAFDLYNTSIGLGAFSRNATGGALTWGRPLSDHASASLTYRIEDVGITSGSGGIANLGARATPLAAFNTANLLRGGRTSSVRGTFGWDSRDNRLIPTEGWHATAFAEYAGRITGSENQFVRWGGFARRYHRLGGPFVLRLNGELGVTTSLDGRGVPLSERYLLGGITDLRGYATRSLGPHLAAQHPGDVGHALDPLQLGGNLQVIGNAEIEFPLVKKLGLSGVAFFDLGNAYNLEGRFCSSTSSAGSDACVPPSGMLGGLRKSVGFGVRWLSPIGPLRLEWGIPLDLKRGEKPAGLEFTIGTSF